ncbi:MAG: dipeptide epimerase [Candidatus Aminicenantes bacterium]|nr:dipeptide epimerase [Candidatus Aminicenantes bacterium]
MTLTRKSFLTYLGLGAAATALSSKGMAAAAGRGFGPAGSSGRALEETRKGVKSMKIKDIEIYAFDIKLVSPFVISIGQMDSATDVLIRIITDAGIVGVGEACPFPPITGETQETNIAAARTLREMFVGKDPLAIEAFLRGAGPIVHTNPSIVAAFDMALFDILGKTAGLPVYRLLGGGDRTRFATDITVSLETPEAMAAEAKAFADRGYRTIKVKVGQGVDLDVARIKGIREAVGDAVALRIDANQGWTVPQAKEALGRLAAFRVEFCEQPGAAWDIAGMREVRSESPIAIMADEALFGAPDAIKLIRADACDYFNIKLMKAGGIFNSVKIAHIADAANLKCMVGCMLESRLALTAAAHVVASQANIWFADLDGNSEHVEDPIVGGVRLERDELVLPDGPGLGCDVDPAYLKKLRKI